MLNRFGMKDCVLGDMPITKGNRFSLSQCSKNELEQKEIQKFPYTLPIRSLMYAQVCTCLDIAYIVRMLGKYVSNPEMDHWKATKRVIWYLQRTKDYMITYKRPNRLEIVGYSDFNFVGCLDSKRCTLGYVFI